MDRHAPPAQQNDPKPAGPSIPDIALAIRKRLMTEARWTHIDDVGANYGEMRANGGVPAGPGSWQSDTGKTHRADGP